MRFFIYSRKSVYTGKGESVENQVEMCREYIFNKYPETAESELCVYEDEGFSAKNTDRPRFRRMLRDLEREGADCIVCYRLDRISRNVSDFSALIEKLEALGVGFICIREEFDTTRPMGKAMMYIASVFAQLERETIAERVRDNMLMLARTGRWLGGTTPAGFSSEAVAEVIMDGKIKYSHKLRPESGELENVREIFRQYLRFRSVSAVGRCLEERGIKARSGRPYSLPGIKEILQNPVYCAADRCALAYFREKNAELCFEEADCTENRGLISYNKRDYRRKGAPRNPVEDWIIAIGAHEPLIPGEEWTEVQRGLERVRGGAERRVRSDYSLLSGLIICKGCGGKMFAKRRSGNPDKFDYICSGKLRGGSGACAAPNLPGDATDAATLGKIAECVKRSVGTAEHLRKQLLDAVPDTGTELERKIRLRQKELDNLARAIGGAGLDPGILERVNARARQLRGELELLEADMERLGSTAPDGNAGDIEELAGELADFRLCIEGAPIPEKRELVRLAVSSCEWDGATLRIICRK